MCDPTYERANAPETSYPVANAHVNLEAAVTESGTSTKTTVFLQTATARSHAEASKAQVRILFDGGNQRSYKHQPSQRNFDANYLEARS